MLVLEQRNEAAQEPVAEPHGKRDVHLLGAATRPARQPPTDLVSPEPYATNSARTGNLGRFFRRPDAGLVFLLALLLCASGLVSTPVALVAGVSYSMVFSNPFRQQARDLSKLMLQGAVVLLGFGMNLHEVLRVGRSGFVYTAVSIGLAISIGLALGRACRVGSRASFLITIGTAICGGSAIAAVAPVLQASEEEISVSMGTVFLLNSIALLLFPAVGWALHLSQSQFGLWAALAIHDTSSVVGAAARYGTQALAVGTIVKLARALWIIPVSLLTAVAMLRCRPADAVDTADTRIRVPWFIFLFLLASLVSTGLPHFAPVYLQMTHLGKLGLTATLFLIGTGLSRQTIRNVGWRPLLQGIVLWCIVGCGSLAAIYFHRVAL